MQVPVNMNFYASIKDLNKLIGEFVYDAEQKSIKVMYEGLMNGQGLARQTPEWFYKTFTDLNESEYDYYKRGEIKPEIVNNLMNRVSKLNLYDPLTLIATLDVYKSLFSAERNGHFDVLMPKNKIGIYEAFNLWAYGNPAELIDINNDCEYKKN